MEQTTILDISSDPVYQELNASYPQVSTEAMETILQFCKISALINTRREAIFAEHGLTSGRFHLLMLLKRQEPFHALSPSELAKRTGVTRGTMTQFIDAIEKDGFVKRVEDPKDRRGMLVSLTEAGEVRLKEVLPTHINRMEQYTRVLNSEERKMMIQIMTKMASTFSEPVEKSAAPTMNAGLVV
ncbi:MAG: MarR family transcriptional regulator [Bdellovibrionales bacterium]|nr:MarR family transcriptional regulator [Bdellovibrionales bacterium]